MKTPKSLLDKVKFPKDLKKFDDQELKFFCKELRDEVIEAVSVTGGHLGAGLGVVELTVAIHIAFLILQMINLYGMLVINVILIRLLQVEEKK